jgi:hypothetical protein
MRTLRPSNFNQFKEEATPLLRRNSSTDLNKKAAIKVQDLLKSISAQGKSAIPEADSSSEESPDVKRGRLVANPAFIAQ